jgi:hypothetical protein
MGGGGKDFGHDLLLPGLSRFHYVGFIIPLLAALSPMLLARLPTFGPQPVNALLNGIIVGLVVYVFLEYVPFFKETHAFAKAVMLGVIVAEFTVFTRNKKVPAVANIALFIFLYLYGLSKLVASENV